MESLGVAIVLIGGFFTLGLSLECPKCQFAGNVNTCLQQTETCSPYQDVCVGTLQEWKFTMGCGTRKRCEYDELQSTTDCRGNEPFKASDKCTVCCTGAYCNERLGHVQKGLDSIPNVLHCPVCSRTDDPQICLDNIQPCHTDAVTCDVAKQGSIYLSKCATNKTCMHDHNLHPGAPSCLHDPNLCSVCCNNFDCLTHILGVPPTESLVTPPNEVSPGTMGPEILPTVSHTSPGLTVAPVQTCKDDSLFHCNTNRALCSEPDLATFCQATCGLCPTGSPTTVAPQVIQRKCPSCQSAHNTRDCIETMGTCHHPDDVCLIEMRHWKVTAHCASPKMCSDFKTDFNTVSCTAGTSFSPFDKCHVCCTGDDCLKDKIPKLQKGLDAVAPNVHCPQCKDEINPQTCLNNTAPCGHRDQTCEISRRAGFYSSHCKDDSQCEFRHRQHPGAIDCFHDSSNCAVCCHDHDCISTMLEGAAPPKTTQFSAEPCKDKELFPCHLTADDGACADADFAKDFCPESCGVCPPPIPAERCMDTTNFPCSVTPARTCADRDLGAAFCPVTCGMCDPNNGTSTLSPVITTTTTIPPHLQHPTLECPVCRNDNIDDCLRRTTKCRIDQDICMGTLLEWDFQMGCSFSQFCEHKIHSVGSTNCTRGEPYLPHEECTICCTGAECTRDLQVVKQSIESIPNVLHCPFCSREKDPKDCLNNAIACTPLTTTCLVSKRSGKYSSRCYGGHAQCIDDFSMSLEDCIGSDLDCNTCCDHSGCLKEALASTNGGQPTTTPIPPHLVHPTLECPVCRRDHLDVCLNRTQKCRIGQDTCMGTLLEWDFRMECSYSQFCAHKIHSQGTTNCTRGEPYLPHEECYICCTGDECIQDLQIVKQSIESIQNVVHCPICDDVNNPEDCLQNVMPCSPLETSCLITKIGGKFSSRCYSGHSRCIDDLTMPLDVCINSTVDCSACCDNSNCLKQALSKPTPGPTVPTACHESTTFPCATAASTVCSDPDFALGTCPVTCGHCDTNGNILTTTTGAPTSPPPTLPPPTIPADCKDDPGFPCASVGTSICADQDLAFSVCPKLCGHC